MGADAVGMGCRVFHIIPPHPGAFRLIFDTFQPRGRQTAVQRAAMIFSQQDRQIDARVFHKIHIGRGIEIVAVDGEYVEIFPADHHIGIVRFRPAESEVQMILIFLPAGFRWNTDIFPNQKAGVFPDIAERSRIFLGTFPDRIPKCVETIERTAPGAVQGVYVSVFLTQKPDQSAAAAGVRRIAKHFIRDFQVFHKVKFRFVAQKIADQPRIVSPFFQSSGIDPGIFRILFRENVRKVPEDQCLCGRKAAEFPDIRNLCAPVVDAESREITLGIDSIGHQDMMGYFLPLFLPGGTVDFFQIRRTEIKHPEMLRFHIGGTPHGIFPEVFPVYGISFFGKPVAVFFKSVDPTLLAGAGAAGTQ